MKTYIKMILLILSLGLVSCSKWLDVEPKSQVRDMDLFANESGFKESLAGVYAAMTYEPMYGREMTFGLMGVLGYEWDSQNSNYDADKVYQYQSNQTSLNRIDAIWNGAYNAITNDNKLLMEIDAKQSVFTGDNYALIKGEALALRAFLHFDLLRIFGASYAEDPEKIAIPYYKISGKAIAPQLKVREVIDLAIADLTEAAELLKQDPLLTGRTVTTIDDSGYLLNRQVHLNYYAVQGLLARIYLYKQDYVKALTHANVVINSNKFAWIQQSASTDYSFSTEHLFGLNVVRLNTIYENSFTVTGGANIFRLTQANRADYFTSDDYRYLFWFENPASGELNFVKYKQLTTSPQAYRNKMPMIKLAEMYFIAAEAQKNTNITAAAELINTVRRHRGISDTNIDAGNFEAVLAQEFRKEFLGEGQLFLFHKRKNNSIIPRATGINPVALKAYKLPMPLSEYSNAPGRVDNR